MSLLLQRAFRISRRNKRLLLLILDALILSACLVLAMVLKQGAVTAAADAASPMLLISVPLCLITLWLMGFYHAIVRFMGLRALLTMAVGLPLACLTLWGAGQALGFPLSGSTLSIFALLSLLGLSVSRLVVRSLYQQVTMRPRIRVVIYGAGSAGVQLVHSLRQGKEFLPVAFIDDWRGMHGTIVQGLKVYSPLLLEQLIERCGAERILLAMPSLPRMKRREILHSLETLKAAVQTIPAIEDMVRHGAQINEIRDVSVEDLLGREPVAARQELLQADVRDKVVMVTGAGGSIGSELCRQILLQRPRMLLLLELSEFALYAIDGELRDIATAEGLTDIEIKPLLGSVQNRQRLEGVMHSFGVQTLYHAAAYKHVPMVEYNVAEGVRNNVFGTMETALAAVAAEVETFVLVSTDKAVRPTNVMGTTKRLAELICQALARHQRSTRFCMVRFGNVLGSSGSVIPLFKRQIANGGPLTVTHPDITRFFMTIPEAAELVLQAGALGKGGDVFVLDMGEPVKIADLARQMIRLSGLEVRSVGQPAGDIEIVFSGLRPGEKLYEEVLIGADASLTDHPRILTEEEQHWEWERLAPYLQRLKEAVQANAMEQVRELLGTAPTAYQPDSPIVDLEWLSQGLPLPGATPDTAQDVCATDLSLTSGSNGFGTRNASTTNRRKVKMVKAVSDESQLLTDQSLSQALIARS
ncbi:MULTISPECIES: nucleoside-diphosphate sugar epimerase/dehydratase [unclassified Halomonas]|uniref:polysaccharide biosynthesis protein n=1 Tax=unclassified Halomonas TaxID=2609666 RepID=UPI002887A59F|nr:MULTISPECIES: nucleoside-diphosphate sugar epimerase/dehydratase [unclassified Halomonas]MDT0499409.1 nucleoside-diphosphate sugar epimerase/dehydratase [Halomonas sp. PAR7]MDT0510774.1 nucleoside-diphosphate sugar epimerase/dehydratase [Halomonas sp. LES1]MDT0591697.1 nucleoside-diphosphate sugar epimerase/dehydratase [Halomonas sp. PAR8]